LFPEQLARKYREDDQNVLETGQAKELIEEHRLPDGSKLYVEVIKTPIQDASGTMIGIQGLFWDVTERFKSELALADSERRYRQLTEATLDGIIVADYQGLITLFNPAAEKLFGYEANEILGKPITILMPNEYHDRHQKGMQRFLETRLARVIGKPVEMEGLRHDGSHFPLELVLTVIEPAANSDPTQVQFLGAIRDLTERNRMRSVLVQNEKLASIGLLSAGVAHEINNPLAFVGNNLAVLERDLTGVMAILSLYQKVQTQLAAVAPETSGQIAQITADIDLPYIQENLARLIARSRDGVERVARIVQSLRGLARTDKPRRQVASLPDLIEATLEMLRNRMRKGNIQVETRYDTDPSLMCVPTQLSQVFLNLLVNAVQAIESLHRTEDNWIKVNVRRLEEEMLIQVADNGCGMDEDTKARIFDPFFTTKDVGEGTGLGLSITHNIITGHGGRIEVNSTVGQGTVFRLLLPLNPL
jgi:PAS domain S-box-containing protein